MKKPLFILCLLAFMLPGLFRVACVQGQVASIDHRHSFLDATWGQQFGWREDASVFDAGGVLTFFIDWTAAGAGDSITAVEFRTGATLHEPAGYRVWPSTPSPSGAESSVSTVHVKGLQYPFREGDMVDITVRFRNGAPVQSSLPLRSVPFRISNAVPDTRRGQLLLYYRNDDTVTVTLDSLLVNRNVYIAGGNAALEAVGDSWAVEPGQVLILKLHAPGLLEPGTPLAIRTGYSTPDGGYYWTSAGIRVVEAEYILGTWHSSLFNPESNYEIGRQALRKLSINTVMGPGNPAFMETAYTQYHMKAMWNPGVHPDFPGQGFGALNTYGTSPFLRTWFIDDEPDLSSDPIGEELYINKAFWEYAPTLPSYVNLAGQKKFNRYGWFADIVSMDHYAAPGAPNIIPLSWVPIVGRTGALKEALEYTEYLKFNTEPRRMWSWCQLGASAGWNQQPTPAAIDYQFWAHLLGGAKGIQWFVAQTNTSENYPDAWQTALSLTNQFNPVRNLCLYAEYARAVEASTEDVSTRMLIGEDAVLIGVLNDQFSHQWLGSFFPIEYSSVPSPTQYTLTFDLPAWIEPEDIYLLTPQGRAPVNGLELLEDNRYRLVPEGPVFDRAHIYVIGTADREAPEAPAPLVIPPAVPGADRVLSWKVPYDNRGVSGYYVRYNGIAVDTVPHPIYVIDTLLYTCAQSVWSVAAFDIDGNTSGFTEVVYQPENSFTHTVLFTQFPEQVQATPGEEAVLATAWQGTGPIAFQWQFKTASDPWQPVPDNADFTGATTPVLTIREVTEEMADWEFRCIAGTICQDGDTTDAIALNMAVTTQAEDPTFSNAAWHVYPNPAADWIVIETRSGSPLTSVQLINSSGQVVAARFLNGTTPTDNIRMPTGGLDRGIYTIRLIGNNATVYRKLVLQ